MINFFKKLFGAKTETTVEAPYKVEAPAQESAPAAEPVKEVTTVASDPAPAPKKQGGNKPRKPRAPKQPKA